MKIKHPLLHSLVLAGLALSATAHAATFIYSDDFSGSSSANLHGTTPDVTTGGTTWIAHENWKADGSIASGATTSWDHSAFLPFVPASGKVYTLTATLNQPTGGSSSPWAAIGFTNDTLGTAVGNNLESFWAETNNASPWVLYRTNTNITTFNGPGVSGTNVSEGDFGGSRTLTIVLDTTATQWTAEWFVDATSVRGPEMFTTNPTISYVGLGREDGAATTFSNFSLTVVPEPSTALLGGLCLLALLRRRR